MASITGMGDDWELRIGPARAAKILAPYPLPRMGYETDVCVKPDGLGFKYRLTVQNISGQFVLCSCNVRRDLWGEVFGAEFAIKGQA